MPPEPQMFSLSLLVTVSFNSVQFSVLMVLKEDVVFSADVFIGLLSHNKI